MARERDEGFRYCSQDTDTFFDPKIRMLIASHGCSGYAVWDYIKLAAYREHGYYVEWDECRAELACADLGISPEKIGLIIDYLLRRSLLCCIERKTCTSRSGVKVLTSHGIQKRFQRIARDLKRTYAVDREIWLLSEDETLDCVKGTQKTGFSGKSNDNSGKTGGNSEENGTKSNQNKSNKRKESLSSSDACAREGDDDQRENEILGICGDAIGSIDAAERTMLLTACAGLDMEEIRKAVGIAKGYGARTAKYLAQAIQTQREKPGRKPKTETGQTGKILQGGMRPAPKIPGS